MNRSACEEWIVAFCHNEKKNNIMCEKGRNTIYERRY